MTKKVVIGTLFSLLTSSLFAQKRDASIDSFWTQFRTAVIKKDYKKLESLTQFPLIVKGTLDFDTVRKFKKEKFEYIFKHYLKQENTTVTGNALEDIEQTETLPASIVCRNSLTTFRFSDMQFKKIKGSWRLYLVYIETIYQEENNIR